MIKILSILVVLITSFGYSQISENPIDIRNHECLEIDSNMTTYGMIRCETIAMNEWGDEMNKYYDLLLDTLSQTSANLLRESQFAWNDFMEKEQKLSVSIFYGDMDGTMWRIVNAGRLRDLVRSRALELEDYYDLFVNYRE